MKRTMVIFALMSLTVVVLFVGNQARLFAKPPLAAQDTMTTARQLYEAGQYAQAAQGYQQLADQGFAGSALFYNLGNAYFKQNDYGRAILNYRRAQQLAPRDADIQANLDLARARIIDQAGQNPADTPAEGFFIRLGRQTQRWLTLNELALLAVGLWFWLVALAILFGNTRPGSFFREGLPYALVISGLVLMVGLVSLGSRLYVEHTRPEGVIVAHELNVTSGPGSQYVTAFTLHSGAEVNLVEQRGNWIRLAMPDNTELQGWAPVNAVEAIGG